MMVFPFLFIGSSELFFIAFVVVLVFGADKVPEIARGVGKGIHMVKNATNDIKDEITQSAEKSFDTDFGKDIKKEVEDVKEDIEEISGTIKRTKF